MSNVVIEVAAHVRICTELPKGASSKSIAITCFEKPLNARSCPAAVHVPPDSPKLVSLTPSVPLSIPFAPLVRIAVAPVGSAEKQLSMSICARATARSAKDARVGLSPLILFVFLFP